MPDLLYSPSERERWRRTDFASVEDAEQMLASFGALLSHLEPVHNQASQYMHPGYKAIECSQCGRPTIVGRESSDTTCGRPACQAAANAQPRAGQAAI